MNGYCNAVRKLEKKFEGLELYLIPWIKNQAANDLAKIGSTRKPVPNVGVKTGRSRVGDPDLCVLG